MSQGAARDSALEVDAWADVANNPANMPKPALVGTRRPLTNIANRERGAPDVNNRKRMGPDEHEPNQNTRAEKNSEHKLPTAPSAETKLPTEHNNHNNHNNPNGPTTKRARRSHVGHPTRIPIISPKRPDICSEFDEEDAHDIKMVGEYVDEIYALSYENQSRYVVGSGYIERHPQLGWDSRCVLLDWLVSVQRTFRLLNETIFLTINTIDRFLALCPNEIELERFQLVGLTALFISSKYEETYSPGIQNYEQVANVTAKEILDMEVDMLRVLEYDMSYYNPLGFVRRLSRADFDYDQVNRAIAKFLITLALFDKTLVSYRPSDVAAGAMYLARDITRGSPCWDEAMVYFSGGCTAEALAPIVAALTAQIKGCTVHRALVKLYRTREALYASNRCRLWLSKKDE